jgi:hypothetical protein
MAMGGKRRGGRKEKMEETGNSMYILGQKIRYGKRGQQARGASRTCPLAESSLIVGKLAVFTMPWPGSK